MCGRYEWLCGVCTGRWLVAGVWRCEGTDVWGAGGSRVVMVAEEVGC